jgi:hypothetical protein
MIPIILLQLFLVTLESISIIRFNHPLESRRRMCKDIGTSLIYRQIRRYGSNIQILRIGRGTRMTEREESAMGIGCVCWIVLSSAEFEQKTYRSSIIITPNPISTFDPHGA